MMRRLHAICLVLLICSSNLLLADQPPLFIPAPQEFKLAPDEAPFDFRKKISESLPLENHDFENHLEFVSKLIKRRNMTHFGQTGSDATIKIQVDDSFKSEQCRIKVNEASITITVTGLKSLTRATATMLQLACQGDKHRM